VRICLHLKGVCINLMPSGGLHIGYIELQRNMNKMQPYYLPPRLIIEY
jgi:hypothetical protein